MPSMSVLTLDRLTQYNDKLKETYATSEQHNALNTKVTRIDTAVTTLNGVGEGSVKKTVQDEIAKIVAEAPTEFDTLKEISDWIGTHKGEASTMNSAIKKNETDITAIKATLEGLEETPLTEYLETQLASYVKTADLKEITEAEITALFSPAE